MAYNFWLLEALMEDGCVSTGESGGCVGSVNDLMLVSQDGDEPGCVQFDSARDAGSYPPPSYFQSVACGVTLNFYAGQDAGTYVYYQNNGNGDQLGYCYQNNGQTYNCLDDDGLGLTEVTGRYTCNNYSNDVNGINPCT
ncbi:hypothetical protein N5P37_006743 [Trichoderma harzianum]|nr:hypothetical protein N5P37_006743 [Trichoderma harzianum]